MSEQFTPSSATERFTYQDRNTGESVEIDCTSPPVPLPHIHFLPDTGFPSYFPPGHDLRRDDLYVYVNKRQYIHAEPPAVPDMVGNLLYYADLDTMFGYQGAHVAFTGICANCRRPIRFGEVIGGRSRPGRNHRPLQFWHADCGRPFGAVNPYTHGRVPSSYAGGVHDPMVRSNNSTASNETQSEQSEQASEQSSATGDDDSLAQLTELINGIVGRIRAEYDPRMEALESKLRETERELQAARENATRELTITIRQRPRAVTVQNGTTHFRFPLLLKTLMSTKRASYRNIWLCGPAGTGKTTAASQAARLLAERHGKTLGVDFHLVIIGTVASQYELRGFIDANGVIRHPEIERAWREGGLILFDEFAGSAWDAVLWTNGGTSADGYLPFAGGMVKRHELTYVIAADNTWGYGEDAARYKRNAMDQSTLNRFFPLPWEADLNLERTMAGTDPVALAWCEAVQRTRDLIASCEAKVTISARQIVMGADLIDSCLMTADEIVTAITSNLASTSKWQTFGAPILEWQATYAGEMARRIAEAEASEQVSANSTDDVSEVSNVG